MGPFTLLDFVGLDTTYYIANIMFEEYREPAYAPPPLLKRMVLAGRLGKKSGRDLTRGSGLRGWGCSGPELRSGTGRTPASERFANQGQELTARAGIRSE